MFTRLKTWFSHCMSHSHVCVLSVRFLTMASVYTWFRIYWEEKSCWTELWWCQILRREMHQTSSAHWLRRWNIYTHRGWDGETELLPWDFLCHCSSIFTHFCKILYFCVKFKDSAAFWANFEILRGLTPRWLQKKTAVASDNLLIICVFLSITGRASRPEA